MTTVELPKGKISAVKIAVMPIDISALLMCKKKSLTVAVNSMEFHDDVVFLVMLLVVMQTTSKLTILFVTIKIEVYPEQSIA